ncbi:MAG: ABC transporter permease [Chromatiales bacterium]|jgi:peptide/nickel transport system permease protein|nr:ABC transporter permease [Chromatiales bacterium]
MHQYLLKRTLLIPPTLIGAALLAFALMRLVPGDICLNTLFGEGLAVSEAALQHCRDRHGLDVPLLLQFTQFLGNMLTFDFGTSMWTGRPIGYEVELRFELTVQLALMTLAVSVAIALPLGIASAVKRHTWVDYLIRTFAIAGEAIPSFWLGIMIIVLLLIGTQHWLGTPWLPPLHYVPIWEDPLHNLSQLILPALATGYRSSAILTRMTRSAMLEVLREDYIRTARAKGLGEHAIRLKHALKNAMLPVVTLIGMELAFLIGGLVVTEQVFNLNGLGQLLVDAVEVQDYRMTESLVVLIVSAFVILNFLVDILYAWLDPRIRYS